MSTKQHPTRTSKANPVRMTQECNCCPRFNNSSSAQAEITPPNVNQSSTYSLKTILKNKSTASIGYPNCINLVIIKLQVTAFFSGIFSQTPYRLNPYHHYPSQTFQSMPIQHTDQTQNIHF